MADVYVVLDNVQYRRRYFQNRNKIRTKDGWQWLTVLLKKEDRDELLIKDAKIFLEDLKWKKKNLESIYHNYCRVRYFRYFWDEFESIYSKNYSRLLDLNLDLLRFIFEKLAIAKKILLASTLDVSSKKGDLLFDICKTLNAKTYISGISGRDYLNFQKFGNNGIKIMFQEFYHPIYKQLYEPFIPCMSSIDLLFNYGDKSREILLSPETPRLDYQIE